MLCLFPRHHLLLLVKRVLCQEILFLMVLCIASRLVQPLWEALKGGRYQVLTMGIYPSHQRTYTAVIHAWPKPHMSSWGSLNCKQLLQSAFLVSRGKTDSRQTRLCFLFE